MGPRHEPTRPIDAKGAALLTEQQQPPRAYPRGPLPHVYLAPPVGPVVAVPAHWPPNARRAALRWTRQAWQDGEIRQPEQPAALTFDGEPGDVGGGHWVALMGPRAQSRSNARAGTRTGRKAPLASDSWAAPGGEPVEGVAPFTPPALPTGPTWAVLRRARVRRARAYNRTRPQSPAQQQRHADLADARAAHAAELAAHLAQFAAARGASPAARLSLLALERAEATQMRARHRHALRDTATAAATLEAIGTLQWGLQGLHPLGLNEGQVYAPAPPAGEPTAGPMEKCVQGRWLTLGCAAGHKAHMWTGCGRLDCTRCAPWTTAQRAQRVWDATSRVATAWGWHVLTVPPEHRAAVGQLDPRDLRAAAWRAVAGWWASRGFTAGGVVFCHPVGSALQCPEKCNPPRPIKGPAPKEACAACGRTMASVDGSKWHPHLNVGVPLVGLDAEGTATVMRGWVSKSALFDLDVRWTRELAELVPQPENTTRLAVTHYRPHHGEKRIRHALRYFARSFPGWSHWTETRGGTRFGAMSNRNHVRFLTAVVRAGLLLDPPASITPCPHPIGEGTCGREMTVAQLGHITTWSGQGPPLWDLRGATAGPPGETWRQQGTTNGAPQGRLELQ